MLFQVCLCVCACVSVCVCFSRSVMSNTLQAHGLQPDRLFCPWNSPGKNTGVGSHALLQGIFPTQGLKLGLLHCRQTLYHLSHLTLGESSYSEREPGAGGVRGVCAPLFSKSLETLTWLTPTSRATSPPLRRPSPRSLGRPESGGSGAPWVDLTPAP